MFDVNLLNPPGIQVGDQNHVISHRDDISDDKTPIIETKEKKGKNKAIWIYIFFLSTLAVVISYLSVKVLYKDNTEINKLKNDNLINPTSFITDIFTALDNLPGNTFLDELSYSLTKAKISFYSPDISILNDVNNDSINWPSGFGKIHGNVKEGGFLVIEINFDHQRNVYQFYDVIPKVYTLIFENKVHQITEGDNFIQFQTDISQLEEIFSDLDDQSLVLQNNLYLKLLRDVSDESIYQAKIETAQQQNDNNN
mgnify:CR=1 FL=1